MRGAWVLLLPIASGCTLCVSVDRIVVDVDAGDASPDGGTCAGAPADPPKPIAPWNGSYTGSLHAPGTLRPRFRWTAVALPDGGDPIYEIAIDDECPIGDHARCEMPDPLVEVTTPAGATEHVLAEDLPVSHEPPVGTRYVWRLRACDACGACGPWSVGRYVDVGRESQDVDGDGYADVLVGAYGKNGAQADEGAVYLHLGGPDGVAPDATYAWAGPTAQIGTLFGRGLAIVDLDADGFGDVAASSYGEDAPEMDEGVTRIYRGGVDGPSAVEDVVIDCPADQASALAGTTLSDAGDVDADGYRDLFVGAYLLDAPALDEGGFYVVAGGPNGAAPWPSFAWDSPLDEESTLLGHTVCAGDLDADGFGDLVVGAVVQDGVDADTGAIDVFLGSPRGLGVDPAQTLTDGAAAANDHFGTLACAGDLDDDGRGDVVVGAPYADGTAPDGGVVHLYFGAAGGLEDVPRRSLSSPLDPADGGMFGAEIAGLGDVDGDGSSDVLVGAPQYTVGPGVAFLYLGDAEGTFDTPPIAIAAPVAQTDAHFGGEVAGLGDVDGDGHADFAIGAPVEDAGAADSGAAYSYRGGPEGLSADRPLSLVNPVPVATDLYGASIAWRNPGP